MPEFEAGKPPDKTLGEKIAAGAVGVGIAVVFPPLLLAYTEILETLGLEKKAGKKAAETALEKAAGKTPVSKALIEMLFGGQQAGHGEEAAIDAMNAKRRELREQEEAAAAKGRPTIGVQMLPMWDADP